MNFTIVDFDPKYEAGIQQLEKEIVQGKGIQLKTLKNHFLDRATVFGKYLGFLTLNEATKPIGVSIAAQTKLRVNTETFDAGILYDVKVHPAYRNQGINRSMSKYAYSHFFIPNGLTRNFITLKMSNVPVLRSALKAISKMWLYDFVYLTLPTQPRIPIQNSHGNQHAEQRFAVTFFDETDLDKGYCQHFASGLACFYTQKMYQLRITHINFWYKLGLSILKALSPLRYAHLPKEQDTMAFGSLYNHAAENISQVNEVLEHLYEKNIPFLMVCCQKNDCIYNALQKYSINTFGYFLLSDFELQATDALTIDVRCL